MPRTVVVIGLILAVVGYRSATGQQDDADNSKKTPAVDDSSETERGPNDEEGLTLYLQHREAELSALEVLLKDYSRDVLPENHTRVKVEVLIERFFSFDAAAMEYSMQLTIMHRWRDPRLDFDNSRNLLDSALLPLAVPGSTMDKIWTPETNCFYEKEGDDKEKESDTGFMEIHAKGDVVLQKRMSKTFICPMDFHKFPFDTQECILPFVNSEYSSTKVKYIGNYSKSIDFDNAYLIPEYRVGELTSRNCSELYPKNDVPCVIYAFKLTRKIGYYVIYFYIPTLLMVVLSWLPFWGNIEQSSSGVGHGMSIIMALALMSLGFNGFLPRVSYVKAVDVWQFVCVVFVVVAIIQHAAVDYRFSKAAGNAGGLSMLPRWRRHRKVVNPDENCCAVEMSNLPSENGVDLNNADPEMSDTDSEKIQHIKTRAEQMNVASRFCYPFVFLVFAIAYFVYYRRQ